MIHSRNVCKPRRPFCGGKLACKPDDSVGPAQRPDVFHATSGPARPRPSPPEGFPEPAAVGLTGLSIAMLPAPAQSLAMLRKQILVSLGIAAALLIILALPGRIDMPASLAPAPASDLASRLAYVVSWLLAPALCLLAGIVSVAAQRFFVSEAIDGTRAPQSRFLEINLRYNQNTLEQTVLAACAWLGLAVAAPLNVVAIVPLLAVLFVAGRILFWTGYLIAPWARAFGFGLTFYPTAATLLWLAFQAVRGS